ncbi:MAG: response regulator [Dehalococcoidia bacterium]|nr:response regulator [Dehalococcoidia bacterium]
MTSHILVVDDEPTLVATIKYNLEREGYRVMSAADGAEALEIARAERPALIILDLILPGLPGLEVCRLIRQEMRMPILMLTAKADEIDKVTGLALGADDYMTKPFSMRELLARVQALLRRAELPAPQEDVLISGDLRIDLQRRQVYRKGEALALKPKEFELLLYFMRHRGRAFSREDLMNGVWSYEFGGDSRTVDVHVSWLRQKIEDEPAKPTRLITLRGMGYRFDG